MVKGTPSTSVAAIRAGFDASEASFEETLAIIRLYAREVGQAAGIVDETPGIGIEPDGFEGEYDKATRTRLNESGVTTRGDRLIEFAHEVIRLVEV